MQVPAARLSDQLARGFKPVYLIAGDEPLLVEEAADAVREAARARGFERELHVVESGFDWGAFRAASISLSLFSPRRLIELRLPKGSPDERGGEEGGQAIQAFAEKPPADTLLLIVAGKGDKGAKDKPWTQAVETAGVLVFIPVIGPRDLPAWIASRLQARGLRPGPGVVERLAYCMEGNLLACAQEIDKLALVCTGGTVEAAVLERQLSDHARFNVFGLAEAALGGDTARALRMLAGLRGEGTEPILIAWSLAREVRALVQMAHERAGGKPEEAVLARAWSSRKPLFRAALRRHDYDGCLALLQRAAFLDRVIKGRAAGERWQATQELVLALCGVNAVMSGERQ